MRPVLEVFAGVDHGADALLLGERRDVGGVEVVGLGGRVGEDEGIVQRHLRELHEVGRRLLRKTRHDCEQGS